MSLSTYIIGQNEEMYLAKAIASVKDISDEIILVTDYNVDRTVEIAKSMGAKVVFLPESFDIIKNGWSAYENFAIKQCSKDWILKLDADEELTNPKVVKELIDNTTNRDALTGIRNEYAYPGHSSQSSWYPEAKLSLFTTTAINRLWRNTGKDRYKGFTHPSFFCGSNCRGGYYLKHLGFSKPWGLRIRKSRLYSRLLLHVWDNPNLRAGLGQNWFTDYIPKNMETIKRRAAEYTKFYETDYSATTDKQILDTIRLFAQRDIRFLGFNADIKFILLGLGFNFVEDSCDTLICIDNYTDFEQCYNMLKDKGILILLHKPNKAVEKLFYPLATANSYVYIKRRVKV